MHCWLGAVQTSCYSWELVGPIRKQLRRFGNWLRPSIYGWPRHLIGIRLELGPNIFKTQLGSNRTRWLGKNDSTCRTGLLWVSDHFVVGLSVAWPSSSYGLNPLLAIHAWTPCIFLLSHLEQSNVLFACLLMLGIQNLSSTWGLLVFKDWIKFELSCTSVSPVVYWKSMILFWSVFKCWVGSC